MEYLQQAIDMFLHLDKHLAEIIAQYGLWTMLILFIIVFCETGLVVTPFLPGDSLLFAVGIFTAKGSFDPATIIILLCVAGIIGDAVNYSIGKYLGPAFVERNRGKLLKKEHLEATHRYFEKYGKKTIVIARFLPIIRTLAPFMAGVGKMEYIAFARYNVIGAILWVNSFVWAGYFFGELDFVKNNFTYVVLGIIAISCLPVIYEAVKHWQENRVKSGE